MSLKEAIEEAFIHLQKSTAKENQKRFLMKVKTMDLIYKHGYNYIYNREIHSMIWEKLIGKTICTYYSLNFKKTVSF